MKKITLLVLFLSTFWGYSQVKNYTFTQTTSAYTEITGTALGDETSDAQSFVDQTVPLGGATLTGPGIPIGFTFTFNGYVYDRFAVSTDGWISLGSSAFAPNAVNCTVTDATAPLSSTSTVPSAELSAKIAGLAKNLQAQSGSTLTFATIGTAPNRVLVVQWKKYRRSGITGDDFNFQIRLNETSNTVSIAYGSFVNAPSASTYAYQVGMRAEPTAVASNFVNRKSTTGWNATVAGTAATDTVLMSDLIVPSSGLNFTWTPPTCAGAKGLVASAATVNSATLNWGAYTPTPASYEYIVSTLATLPLATVSGTATTDISAAISGLNTNTIYYVFIRTKCDIGFTPWVLGTAFKTPCPDVTTYFEDFDTYSTNILPNCWDKGATTGSSYINSGSVAPMTPGNKLYLNAVGNGTTPTVAYAIMPPVSNLQAGTYRLRFLAYSSSGTDRTLDVGYVTNPNDVTSFVLLQTISLPGTDASTAKSFVVTPGVLPAGVKSLVFKNKGISTGSTAAYIDDVMYEPIPACADIPATTTVKEITHNSVKFSWTKGNTETEWQYAFGPSTVLNPNSLTPVTYSGATTATVIGGLSPSTKYRLWIRSKCGATDFGAWTGSAVFTTTCAPITQFMENFDASLSLPACWSKIGTTGSVTANSVLGTSTFPNALVLSGSATTAPALVSLPALSNTGAGTHRLRFRARRNLADSEFDIGYFTDVSDVNTFVYLQTVTLSTEFDSYIVSLGSDPKSPYLGFRQLGTPNSSIYIDDITWEPISSCYDITALASTAVAASTASFSWKAGGSENAWQYVVVNSTLKDPFSSTPVDVSTNKADVTGLSPSTSYKIWVRSKCSDTSFGAWMGPLVFKTSCSSITSFLQTFDVSTTMPSCWGQVGTTGGVYVTNFAGPTTPNAMYLYNSATGGPAILSMQPVSNAGAGTHRLRFKAKANVLGAGLEVGYLMNFTNPASFVSLYTYKATQISSFESIVVEMGDAPTTEVLAFRNSAVAESNFYVDDVIWEKIPTCADVSNVAVTATTASTATLIWTAGASEKKWEYVIGSTAVSDPNTLTPVEVSSSAASIAGLTPATSYRLWVRSKCSTTDLGAWIGPIVVPTTCTSVTEFAQNFDASTVFPSCWNKVGVGSPSITALTDAPSKSNALSLYSPSSSAQAIVAMPPVSNISATDHILKFKFRGATVGALLEVGYLSTLSDPNSFVPFKSITATSATAFQTVVLTLSNPLSNILAFRNVVGAGSVYIDDVSWDFVPTTVPVCATGISAVPHGSCGNFATVISWSAVSNVDGYKLTVGTTPGGLDVLNNQDVSGLSYSVVGNINTTYYYLVKPYNSVGTALECAEQTFVTKPNGCYCTSLPTSKDGVGITNVQVGGSGFVIPAVTYTDNSANPVNLVQGVNSNLKITFNTGGSGYFTNVWIDFNNNFTFEASEIVYTGLASELNPSVLDASFLMPATAQLGTHKMRIGSSYAKQTPENPCYSLGFGITVDFMVTVVAPEAILGVNPFDSANFSYYPNPVKDILNLSFNHEIANVSVMNLLGQQVISKSLNANQGKIDMSYLSKGAYLVKVTVGNQSKTIKVIKE